MSPTPLQESSRRTAIIFWVMTALFTAQMVWWIIFQLSSAEEELALRYQGFELQRYVALENWRSSCLQLADSLEQAWAAFDNPAALSVAVSRLDGWHAVTYEDGVDHTVIARHQDSCFPVGRLAIPVGRGTAHVQLDVTGLQSMLDQRFPGIACTPLEDSIRTPHQVVTVEQFSMSDEARATIESQHKRRVRMFTGEGSFFLLLIAFGAFAIHRALGRTREFELRQQNFLAAVTHELKSPLASIRLYAETLTKRTLPEDKQTECLTHISEDVERLQSMIEDTLEAGVFGRRTFHLYLEERDLSNSLDNFIRLYDGRAERSGVTLRRHIAPGVIVNFDNDQLRRAVGAIIGNAVKYTQLSESARTVSVDLTARGRDAIITVADEGVGISPEDQKRVFERFYRAGDELTRRVKGSGLGLYLAREIVLAHKGRISLESDGVGHGTQIQIVLPLVRVEQTA